MKQLLISEMEHAIKLLKSKEKPFDYDYKNPSDAAEIKRLMLSIRKHSIQLERKETTCK